MLYEYYLVFYQKKFIFFINQSENFEWNNNLREYLEKKKKKHLVKNKYQSFVLDLTRS